MKRNTVARENRRAEHLATALAIVKAQDAEQGNTAPDENVTARFLALAGAHVIVANRDGTHYVTCEACGDFGGRRASASFYPNEDAQSHAEKCRRLPERLWPKAGAR